MKKFISYLRVSTKRQGQSGLGLEAQRESIRRFISSCEGGGAHLHEYLEVESGKRNDRPVLAEALQSCRLTRATLIVAKLDRLGRNAAFLLSLRESGVDFICADNPQMNTLTVGILAVVAQAEREMISQRVKLALQAAKARGTVLGNPHGTRFIPKGSGSKAMQKKAQTFREEILPIIQKIQAGGTTSFSGIARELNKKNISSIQNKKFYASTIKNILSK